MVRDIISKEYLKSIINGEVDTGVQINGVILVSDYSIGMTKTGKEFIHGNLLSTIKVPFKAWCNSKAFDKLKLEEYENTPVFIRGTADNYNNNGSIILTDIERVEGYSSDQFMSQKYNADAFYDFMLRILAEHVSEKGMKIYQRIMTDDIVKRFKEEFAASGHHDNCKAGLLAHTYKCVYLMSCLLGLYKTLWYTKEGDEYKPDQNKKDLLMLGVALHDLGKIREMNMGVYQECSKVTHRYLGTEYIAEFKKDIIEGYDESWYYDLISIMLQHHGEYGDPCKTFASYVVHKVDLIESQMTYAQDLIARGGGTQDKINIDGTYLTL